MAEKLAKKAFDAFWDEIEPLARGSPPNTRRTLIKKFEQALLMEADRQRQQCCYINRLPDELMRCILVHVMELYRPEKWEFEILNALSSVQKSWRMITDTPTFWPTFRVEDPSPVRQRVLANNTNGPLTVLALTYGCEGTPLEDMRASFSEAARERLRWRGLHCSGGGDVFADIEDQLVKAIPDLQDLRLRYETEEAGASWNIATLSEGCNFRVLWTSSVTLPWHSTRFRDLQSLLLLDEMALPSLVQITNMLSTSPSLKELVLRGVVDMTDGGAINMDVDVIHLPRLEHIVLVLDRITQTYLHRRIQAENCRSLYGGSSRFSHFGSPDCAISMTMAPILTKCNVLRLYYWSLPRPLLCLSTTNNAGQDSFWTKNRTDGLCLNLAPGTWPAEDSDSLWLPLAKLITSACTELQSLDIELSEFRGDDPSFPTPDFKSLVQELLSASISVNFCIDHLKYTTAERLADFLIDIGYR